MLAGCLGGRPSVLALPVNAVECRFTEEPPAIDGALDDAAWNQAVTIENFIMLWLGERGAGEAHEPGKATRAKMLWDRENLYVAAEAPAELDDTDLVVRPDASPAAAASGNRRRRSPRGGGSWDAEW
jgi:hypothetical protein